MTAHRPSGPVALPAAWRGAQISAQKDWVEVFDEALVEEWDADAGMGVRN